MGSIISKIYDDYEDYEWLCEQLLVEPMSMTDGKFLNHAEQLIVSIWDQMSNDLKESYVVHRFAPYELTHPKA